MTTTYALADLDFTKVYVKPPRRFDSTHACKVFYDHGKLMIDLEGVKLLQVKTPSPYEMYVQVKLRKEDIKQIRRLENQLVNIAVENTVAWFNDKITPAIVEEYFVSSILYDACNGTTFKCKLEESCPEIQQFLTIPGLKITLRAKYLRFNRRSFTIGWSLEHVERDKGHTYLFNDSDSDDEESRSQRILDSEEDEFDETSFGPDNEQLKEMMNDLVPMANVRLDALKLETARVLNALERVTQTPCLKYVEELYEVLETGENS